MPSPLKIPVVLERKHPKLAAFVVVPAAKIARWKLAGTTTVEATLDGVALGRRSLHRWDDERWFLELRREHLEATGKGPGDRATLVLAPASEELPAELQQLIDTVPAARASWERCTLAQRRMLREEILGARTSATRERRARKALLPEKKPAPRPVKGLGTEPRTLRVRIVARRLPGRSCGPYREVSVALPRKGVIHETDRVPADAREAAWETTLQVFEKDGATAFRGEAVNGPPHERFLYLTWTGREGNAAAAMFRRAKLRLDAIPPAVLAESIAAGLLLGKLDLTAADGMPVCASVRPPVIRWTSS